jgi:hypothetical protein
MLGDLWLSLGFGGNPYQATPLRPTAEDYDLFIGREETGVDFRTLIECQTGCVAVLSGDVGVGKTSFFNIQQYLLFTGLGDFGPRVIPALELTPLEAEDSPTELARRVTHNAVKSVEDFCSTQRLAIPRQITKIKKWLSHTGSAAGFDFGLSILGSGGNVSMSFHAPPVQDATLENWKDILLVIASEVRETLGYAGYFVALDNAENVDNAHLCSLLMSFRDTLFVVPGIWWVIIGQSGLYSLIDAADKRISQRIQGTGIEITPLSAEELHGVVQRRVQTFRARPDAVSPISQEIHKRLFEASRGEIRFVLKISDDLVRRVVADVRKDAVGVVKQLGGRTTLESRFADFLAQRLVDGQIPDDLVRRRLRDLASTSIRDLRLRKRELAVLQAIGDNGEARASDHQRFRVKTIQDFSANYLVKLFKSGLLHRRQAGPAVYYSLRGFAALAHEFDLFPSLIAKS